MPHAVRLLASTCIAVVLSACLSYPEVVTIEERDASVAPERPDAGRDAERELERDAGPDASASVDEPAAASEPSPPPDDRPCEDCPAGTRCCAKANKGKGKGGKVVCRPATAECDD